MIPAIRKENPMFSDTFDAFSGSRSEGLFWQWRPTDLRRRGSGGQTLHNLTRPHVASCWLGLTIVAEPSCTRAYVNAACPRLSAPFFGLPFIIHHSAFIIPPSPVCGKYLWHEKVANVDGAPWIRNQIEFHGLVDAIGLDFYHLRENLQKSRRIVFGEESAQGKTWLEGVMHTFRHAGL